VLSSLAVLLKKWGEFSSKYEGEVGSGGSVLYHVEKSVVEATWKSSGESGVEGVVGDGERETVAACEDDEEGMINERKKEGEMGVRGGSKITVVTPNYVRLNFPLHHGFRKNQEPIIYLPDLFVHTTRYCSDRRILGTNNVC
jgi:hypothetical protein